MGSKATALLPSLRVSGALRRGTVDHRPQWKRVGYGEPIEEEESDFELEDLEEEEHLLERSRRRETLEEEETLEDEER